MAGDWIRLHRKALESRVFSDPWLWQLWCWCLLNASWKTGWKFGRELKPGQFATDKRQAAERLNVSPSRVYRGLHTLQEWGQIRLEVNHRFTVVTVCKWATYQTDDDDAWTADEPQTNRRKTADEPLADRTRTTEKPLSLREEGKEMEEGKTNGRAPPRAFVKPTPQEVAAYCQERKNRVDPQAFVDHYESNGWRVGRTPMKDWRAAVRTWEKREAEFRPPGRDAPTGPKETHAERAERLQREREHSRSQADPEAAKALLDQLRGRVAQ